MQRYPWTHWPADPTPPADAFRIGVLYENASWIELLREELDRRALPYDAIDLTSHDYELAPPTDATLYFNRVSPSSHLRGHDAAVPLARTWMQLLESYGTRVINGSRSFHLETSKVAQLLLLRQLGVRTPRTWVFNDRRCLKKLRDFPFPAILKPDTGGSGAGVRKVHSYDELVEVMQSEEDLFGPDHLLLLQEYIDHDAIVRTEFVDTDLVYATRVVATNTFNLCPADGCERSPAGDGPPPSVQFVPYPEIPRDAVAQAREVVRAAGLDVGGVEYVETAEGERVFFDINATSVYRSDVSEAFGIEGFVTLVDFLEREFHKENAKRRGSTRGLAV
ncbi:MAG: hypothetical protein AAF488_14110 [Planctomycetota bacterium]